MNPSSDDHLWHQLHWYAVQSKPGREGCAAASVRRFGIPVLFPKIRRRSRRDRSFGIGFKPLFSGYFFAQFIPSVRIDQVRYARGVLRVVSSGRVALPLEDAVIGEIEARTGEGGVVEIGPPPFRPGDRVRIEVGPLEGLVGVLERESEDHTRVTILLEALHAARVEIETEFIAEADAA